MERLTPKDEIARLEREVEERKAEDAQRAKTGRCSKCGRKVNRVLICTRCMDG